MLELVRPGSGTEDAGGTLGHLLVCAGAKARRSDAGHTQVLLHAVTKGARAGSGQRSELRTLRSSGGHGE